MQRSFKRHKSVSFYSHAQTNTGKLAVLRGKSVIIRDKKNEMSAYVASNWLAVADFSKFDWCTHLNTLGIRPKDISSNEFNQACYQLHQAYETKAERIALNAANIHVYQWQIDYYKKDTGLKKKGDLRLAENKAKTRSPLVKVVASLAKQRLFSMEQLIARREWAVTKIDTTDTDPVKQAKKEKSKATLIAHYDNCIAYCQKPCGDRIFALVKSRVERIVAKAMAHPICFESLTYVNFNQFGKSMLELRDKRSKGSDSWNAYFLVAAIGCDRKDNRVAIPVKYSRKHHGAMKHFQRINVPYTIIFEEDRIRISVGYECEGVENYDNWEVAGIDLNTKHNLFCSDDINLDFNRKLLRRAQSAISTVAKKLEPTPKDLQLVAHYRRAIEQDIKNRIVVMVDSLKKQGKNHVVVEDIRSFSSNYIRLDWFGGNRNNLLLALLRFGSIKTWISQICEKQGIQVTIAHSHYSSQQCNHCGHISKLNRKTQEEFVCVECGHSDNADANAHKNLANRVRVDVLREKLFDSTNGRFTAKRMSKDKIKSALSHLNSLNLLKTTSAQVEAVSFSRA